MEFSWPLIGGGTETMGLRMNNGTKMLKIDSLVKSFGGLLAIDDLSFQVDKGIIHAVIGPNGAGKTTLISQLTGELIPDSGTVLFDGKDI